MTWTPAFNTAPRTWYARKILDYINSKQADAILFWNTYWRSVIDHELEPVNALSMHVGAPIDLHARGLYAIVDESISEFDNYDESAIRILLAYTTGNVAFEGADNSEHAQQFAATEVSGFYLEMFKSILRKMLPDDLLSGWPDIPRTELPGLRIKVEQTKAKDGGVLRSSPEQGEQLLIAVTIIEDASPIYVAPS